MHVYGLSKSEELMRSEHPWTITSIGQFRVCPVWSFEGMQSKLPQEFWGNDNSNTLLLKVNMAEVIARGNLFAEAEQFC